VDTSKAEIRSVADDVRSEAKDVLAQSREQLRRQSDEQFRNMAGTLSDISRQLARLAEGQPESGIVLDATNGLADTVGQLGERFQRDGIDGALRDATQFARRRPGVFLLASVGGGLLLGRVLRSSDRQALVDTAKSEVSQSTDGESGHRDDGDNAAAFSGNNESGENGTAFMGNPDRPNESGLVGGQ